MTDARLRGEWYGMLRYERMSDPAWRVFSNALMFCAQNGTDGFIPSPFHLKLHPYGTRDEVIAELVNAGLWIKQGDDGYQLVGWDTELGQSTAAEVDAYKANARERQRKFREKQKSTLEKENAKHVTRDVTRDVTSPVTRDVGEGKGEGKGDGGNVVIPPIFEPNVDAGTGEVLDDPQQVTDWWTTPIPDGLVLDESPGDSVTCRECGQEVAKPDPWGLCSKVSAAHVAARKQPVMSAA